MRISSFQITNYKSFIDSGQLDFAKGFNLIIGQNNVGKTALLEAITLTFGDKPHKSLRTLPQTTTPLDPTSWAWITFTLSGEELRDILLLFPMFMVPVPRDIANPQVSQGPDVLRRLLDRSEISFRLKVNGSRNWTIERSPAFDAYEVAHPQEAAQHFYQVKPREDRQAFVAEAPLRQDSKNHEFSCNLATNLIGRIYFFHAERLNVGQCRSGHNEILASNSSNLPEVLNVLQSNPARFEEFNRLVNKIFPSIYGVSVIPVPNDMLRIIVWTEDPSLQRKDLTIDLAESGSGVGQVLAILYVVINSDYSRTIVIDEPNSFLHPGAARKLIEVLKSFPQHQFIIATHSTDIIKATDPSSLFLITWEKPLSSIKVLDAKEITNQKKVLLEVGAKLSDVFGSDQILWVEGDTEEQCFPELIKGHEVRLSTSIVGLRNTGDFETKKLPASMIFDVYTKLTSAHALIPPAIGFIFDQEGRTEREMSDLIAKSQGLVHFLGRRMYENYLFNPYALCTFMVSLPNFSDPPITAENVEQWLAQNGRDEKYEASGFAVGSIDWVKKVHAGRLLNDLFQDLSQARYTYRKTEYSLRLTQIILSQDRSLLADLTELLLKVLRPTES